MPIYISDSSNVEREVYNIYQTDESNIQREIREVWQTDKNGVNRLVFRNKINWIEVKASNGYGDRGDVQVANPASESTPTILKVGYSSNKNPDDLYFQAKICATNLRIKTGDKIQIRFKPRKTGTNFYSLWDSVSGLGGSSGGTYFWSIGRTQYPNSVQSITRTSDRNVDGDYILSWGADTWSDGEAQLDIYDIILNDKKVL